jgi:hypothetical protein
MEPAETHQRQLLQKAQYLFHDTPISQATANAYLATPRHLFVPRSSFIWRTLGIRSFLGVTEPLFKAFKTAKTKERPHEDQYFGLWDHQQGSLVVAKDDQLVSYGHPGAKEGLRQDLARWVDLGMPTTTSFDLRVYPIDASLTFGHNEWLVKRRESLFLWRVMASADGRNERGSSSTEDRRSGTSRQ